MHIFLTGATGFVGSAVLLDLLRAGHKVTALVRSETGVQGLVALGAEAVHGELNDLEALRRQARAADAVVHTAFHHDFSRMAESCELDRLAIDAMGSGLEGSGKPMIVTSGLPPTAGRIATEDDTLAPRGHGSPRVSEQTALSWVAHGVRAMVIRMPQVHDQTKQGFATFLLAHARDKGVSAYVGDGLNRWPAVHRLDAARLYRHVLTEGTAGHCYHAVAQEGITVRDVAETIGKRIDVPVLALTPDHSATHFGWLDRIARMDVPASSALTQKRVKWSPQEAVEFITDLGNAVL